MAYKERIEVLLDVQTTKFKSAMSGIRTDMAAATTSMGKFQAGAKGAFGLANQYAGQLALAGGAAITAFGVKSVKAFQDVALEAGRFAATTGTGVEAASRWREVAGDIGVDAGVLEAGLNKMNVTLGKTPEKFAEYGVAVSRASDGTVDVNQTFLNLVDRLNDIEDPAKRAAVAQALLGKGWTGMSELIAQGSDRLVASLAAVSDSKVVTDEELETAREFREVLDGLSDRLEDVTLWVGGKLTPVLQQFGEKIDWIASGLGKLDAAAAKIPGGNGLVDWVGKAIDQFVMFDNIGKGFARVMDDDASAVERLFGVGQELVGWMPVVGEQFEALGNAIWPTVRATIDADLAMRGAKKVALEEAEAIEKLADVYQFGAENAAIYEAKMAVLHGLLTDSTKGTERHTEASEANARARMTQEYWEGVYAKQVEASTKATEAAEEADRDAADAIAEHNEALQDRIDLERELYNEAQSRLDTQEGFIASLRDMRDAQAEYDELLADSETTTAEADAATFDLAEQYRQLAQEFAEASGAADGSKESIDKQIESLYGVASVLDPSSPLRAELLRYIADLQRIPKSVKTMLEIEQVLRGLRAGSTGAAPGRSSDRGFAGTRQELRGGDGRAFTSPDSKVPLGTVGEVGPSPAGVSSDLMANRFEFGDISLEEYREYLRGLFAEQQVESDSWFDLRGKIRALDEQEAAAEKARLEDIEEARQAAADAEQKRVDDEIEAKRKAAEEAAQAAQDAIDAEDALQKYLYDSGQISLETYKAYLASRQSTLALHSVAWIDLWEKIGTLEEKALADAQATNDRNRAFELEKLEAQLKAVEDAEKASLDRRAQTIAIAKARQDLADAAEEAELAVAAVGTAEPEDMAAAQKRAAEALQRRADAALNAGGILDDTAEWLAGMRSSLEADKANAPGLAAAIDRLLLGIATPGGTTHIHNTTVTAWGTIDGAAVTKIEAALRDKARANS